jgi:transcription elongation factor GreA
MSETVLTRQAYERLQRELEDLTTRGRIEIANVIEAARALGDLKENGDYHAAKDTQGKMEARIRQIQALLANATIVDSDPTETTKVTPGVVVSIRYEDEDETYRFFFGSIEEKMEGIDVISPTSPLGQALNGAAPGDWVEYEAPGGVLRVEVVKIGE